MKLSEDGGHKKNKKDSMFKRAAMSTITKENMEEYACINGVKHVKLQHKFISDYKDMASKHYQKRLEAQKMEAVEEKKEWENEMMTVDKLSRKVERKRNWKDDSRRAEMGEKLINKANKKFAGEAKYVYCQETDSIKGDVEETSTTVITVPYKEDHVMVLPSRELGGNIYRGGNVCGFIPSNRSKQYKEYADQPG